MARSEATTSRFVIVWGSLMVLALASFLLSFLHLGTGGAFIALSIGLIKAVLIATFFMELIDQPSISRWAFAVGIGLALLLLVMIGTDVMTRQVTGITQPGLVGMPQP
jgi:cytochrome c oxidase subunit 4